MQKLTYSQRGDYLFPDLTLPKADDIPLGKFGLMRKKYLKEHRPATYQRLLLGGTLEEHLREIDHQASEMLTQLMDGLSERYRITEAMKSQDQMRWVGEMNTIRAMAEEVVLNDLIYK